MERFRVLPYKQGSKSAKALADELGGKVLKLEGSSFVAKADDVLINWGRTDCAEFEGYPFLNLPEDVKKVSNKKTFFQECAGESWLPKFWLNKEEIEDEDFPVVCRTILAGHSGAGIHIADTRSDLVAAPLYVKYIKKKDEYRIHLGRRGLDYDGTWETEVIAIQRKAKRQDCTDPDWKVRNLAGGFVYVRNDVDPPECVVQAACEAFEKVGVDFGATDVIFNGGSNRAYVLEINTAPGLEGQTIKDYGDFFRSLA